MVDELNTDEDRRMDEMETRTRALAARVETLTAERDAAVKAKKEAERRADSVEATGNRIAEEAASLRAQVEQLAKFKAYVHKRLDAAGVPVDPPSPHREAGCRIGGRLDWVFLQTEKLQGAVNAALDGWQKAVNNKRSGVDDVAFALVGLLCPPPSPASGWTEGLGRAWFHKRSNADRGRGLYEKFRVERTDGSSATEGRHEGCRYFVLDLSHDRYSRPALRAYADACKAEFPLLARDLRALSEET